MAIPIPPNHPMPQMGGGPPPGMMRPQPHMMQGQPRFDPGMQQFQGPPQGGFRNMMADSLPQFFPGDLGKDKKGGEPGKDKDKDKKEPPKPGPPLLYECWTFIKAEPEQFGQSANWSRIHKTQMHVPQDELSSMVKKRKDRNITAFQQYKRLDRTKQAQIDRLIDDRKKGDNNPLYEWTCARIDTTEKDKRLGRTVRRETTSMDVIVQKKLRPQIVNSGPAQGPKGYVGEIVDLNQPNKPKDKDGGKDKGKDDKGKGQDPFAMAGGLPPLWPGEGKGRGGPQPMPSGMGGMPGGMGGMPGGMSGGMGGGMGGGMPREMGGGMPREMGGGMPGGMGGMPFTDPHMMKDPGMKNPWAGMPPAGPKKGGQPPVQIIDDRGPPPFNMGKGMPMQGGMPPGVINMGAPGGKGGGGKGQPPMFDDFVGFDDFGPKPQRKKSGQQPMFKEFVDMHDFGPPPQKKKSIPKMPKIYNVEPKSPGKKSKVHEWLDDDSESFTDEISVMFDDEMGSSNTSLQDRDDFYEKPLPPRRGSLKPQRRPSKSEARPIYREHKRANTYSDLPRRRDPKYEYDRVEVIPEVSLRNKPGLGRRSTVAYPPPRKITDRDYGRDRDYGPTSPISNRSYSPTFATRRISALPYPDELPRRGDRELELEDYVREMKLNDKEEFLRRKERDLDDRDFVRERVEDASRREMLDRVAAARRPPLDYGRDSYSRGGYLPPRGY